MMDPWLRFEILGWRAARPDRDVCELRPNAAAMVAALLMLLTLSGIAPAAAQTREPQRDLARRPSHGVRRRRPPVLKGSAHSSRLESQGQAHFAAVIDSTRIVLVPASSVPITLTFCAANLSGVCWSLSA